MSISAVGSYGSYQTQQSYSVRGGGGGDFAARFAEMDANGDGGLDISESGLSEDLFSKTDADGDGLLTYSDFASRMQSMAGQGRGPGGPGGAPPSAEEMISQLDANGDGELSADEFQIDSEMFSAIDSDGSGSLSQAELEAHQAAMEEQRAAMGQEGASGMAPPSPPSADDLMASLDSDGDGSLSVEESGVSSSTFDAIDTNGDGVISQAELEAYLASQMGSQEASSEANGLAGRTGMAPPPPPSAEEMIAGLDGDDDGELSSEEFQIDQALFSQIDSDGSGTLSQAELEAHRSGMEAQRQADQQTAQTGQSYQQRYGLSAYQAQSGVSPWMLSSYGASGGISLTA